jgi:hypothetical protein
MDVLFIMGGFSIAWLLGLLTPGAPAGLGVREAALVLFLAMFAVIFVSTVVFPACLCGGIVATGPDEFRERGSNRVIGLRRGPLPFPECPCSWLT